MRGGGLQARGGQRPTASRGASRPPWIDRAARASLLAALGRRLPAQAAWRKPERLYGLSSRPLSVFHPANVTSDGWEAPQTPQSHSPAINSCATDLIPRPSVPKSQVEVGWGCILSCMRTCCIGCILYTYSRLSSSRLACHAIQRIQRIQPYSHTRHTSYSALVGDTHSEADST